MSAHGKAARLAAKADLPRVMMVAPQPFFRSAGTPMNVRLMCQALAESGYAIDLLTFPFGEKLTLPQVRQTTVWPIPGLHQIPIGFSRAKVVFDLLLAGLVAWKLMRGRYVAVHAIEEAAFFALPLAWLHNVPGIMDLDSDLEHQLGANRQALVRRLAPLARVARRHVLRRARAAITVAAHLSALVRRESPGTAVFEIRDVPLPEMCHPADPQAVAALRGELALGPGPIAVYTGNFDRRQGVQELIEAWVELRRAKPTAQLVIVGGDAAEVRELRSFAASCLGDNDERKPPAIVFTGRRPTSDMPACMALGDVLVSPRLEPLVTPFKIYTYMASGVPIVATALPTHQEVLDDASAFLVEPTPAGLAGGLNHAFGDPDEGRRRAAAALRLVDQRHNFRVFKAQLNAAYAAVGAAARSAAGQADPGSISARKS